MINKFNDDIFCSILKYIDIYSIDPCDDGAPCSGQGKCELLPTDATDGRTCECDPGYKGDNCEISKIHYCLRKLEVFVTFYIIEIKITTLIDTA